MPLVIYWTCSSAYIGTIFYRGGKTEICSFNIYKCPWSWNFIDLIVNIFPPSHKYKFFIRLQLQHSCQNIDWTNHVLTVFLILALTADWTTCRRDRKVSEKRDLFTLSSNAWALWWFAVCLSTVCTSWGSYQLSCSVTIGPLQVRDSDGGMLLMP